MSGPTPRHAETVTLMTLDPGHFHAALLQKRMLEHIAPDVYVFAPEGPDLTAHLGHIRRFNERDGHPTTWRQHVYTGDDYLDNMLQTKPGSVVVIASVNSRKIHYIQAAVEAGIHVLADKPMCIDFAGWRRLKTAVETAARRKVLLCDIMTGRHEITEVLFKKLVNTPELFGSLHSGTPAQPAVTKQSVHHLYKSVAGQPLLRPGWYFDVAQQGEGMVDVTTHLVDRVMWECFPEQIIDPEADIEILHARRWPTLITRHQFACVTGVDDFPATVREQVTPDGMLAYSCNGDITYTVKGVHVGVSVRWDYQAPECSGDSHTSTTRGTRSIVRVRQGREQAYRPELYVEPAQTADASRVGEALQRLIASTREDYPGLGLAQQEGEWRIVIPDVYRIGHEAHFALVVEGFLQRLQQGRLADWEAPHLLAKYYTTTRALQLALK